MPKSAVSTERGGTAVSQKIRLKRDRSKYLTLMKVLPELRRDAGHLRASGEGMLARGERRVAAKRMLRAAGRIEAEIEVTVAELRELGDRLNIAAVDYDRVKERIKIRKPRDV